MSTNFNWLLWLQFPYPHVTILSFDWFPPFLSMCALYWRSHSSHACTWILYNTSYTMWSTVPFWGVRLDLFNTLSSFKEIWAGLWEPVVPSGSSITMFLLHSGHGCDAQKGWGTIRGWKTKTKVPSIASVVGTVKAVARANGLHLHYMSTQVKKTASNNTEILES